MIFIPKPKQNIQFSESAIRPDELFNEWRKILQEEVEDSFSHGSASLVESACPGCESRKREAAFEVFGLKYHWCDECGSLYASPRPNQAQLDEFYQRSKASVFWRDRVIKSTMAERLASHFQPLINWYLEVQKAYHPAASSAIDYRPKYYTLFDYLPANSIANIRLVAPLHVSVSANNMASSLVELPGEVDIITAFNVLERESNPRLFLAEAFQKLNKGGLLFLTTNTVSGFEYQVLGGRSPNLVPPDRLNLLSVEAMEKILQDAGFAIVDIGTPGKLDVDIVVREFARRPNLPIPDFLKYIFKYRDQSVLISLQNFLQLNNLSSFLRAVAVKK